MSIAGFVAGALCASVGWMVVAHAVRTARSVAKERHDSELALVTDCLANVDRVIDLPSFDRVIDIRDIERRRAPRLVWSIDDATVA